MQSPLINKTKIVVQNDTILEFVETTWILSKIDI
jgi:hypothetical protein